ncbi:zinc-binding protein A33-like [Protopterus annectens]|uniref:zinc-binding protein A33-like n=1 Tax=Protopterus annectens TaxID=7888 RepID=UPI001CF9CCA1|nr:zinc-binding protein A33-like [Protopterus annectens]
MDSGKGMYHTSVMLTGYRRMESCSATHMSNIPVDEDLLCMVCKRIFDNPVILECGHSFCKVCVERFWDSQKDPLCPDCQHGCQTRRYFINRALNNLAQKGRNLGQKSTADESDIYQGSSPFYCIQQGSDLQDSSSIERVIDLRRCTLDSISTDDSGISEDSDKASSLEGSIDELMKKNKAPFWKVHSSSYVVRPAACDRYEVNQKLSYKTDSVVICDQCGDQDKHKHNMIEKLSQAAREYMGKLQNSKMEKLTKLENSEQQAIQTTREKVRNVQEFVDSQFYLLHHFLLEKQQHVIQKLKNEERQILGVMKENLKIIEKEKMFTEKFPARIQIQDSHGPEERGLECPDVECVKKLVTPPDLNVGVYKGPLLYSLWKEMKSIINPGVSPLKLDSNTAHPALHLSKDLTCVRVSDVKQQLSDLPERFDECPCVLGSDGITEGKHYWEVDVVNRTNWVVGMAKESIQRKGKITMTPENGYWTLCLQNGDIYAQDSPRSFKIYAQDSPRSFKLSVKPSRIGVYMDYNAGQVSFYNENISHLYTFHDTFSEAIYPLLGFSCIDEENSYGNLTFFHIKL